MPFTGEVGTKVPAEPAMLTPPFYFSAMREWLDFASRRDMFALASGAGEDFKRDIYSGQVCRISQSLFLDDQVACRQ